MNKLKRPGLTIPPSSSNTSKTLALASGKSQTTDLSIYAHSEPSFDIQPRTNVEQYWAARALKAESFISARIFHDNEVKNLRTSEEIKRSHELDALRRESEIRQARLERLVLLLLGCLFALSAYLIYVLSQPLRHQNIKKSALTHFTIPILSPFASVTEHETSVMGTKSIMFLILVLAVLGYTVFRYWISRRT